uniref:Uncharacterized protein n=1 Tax=Avena sativa TaxID=4498 RepID=A0ACD5U5G3_AVESA
MANEWRALALTVSDTLLEANTLAEALRLIGLAITMLEAQDESLTAYRLGLADGYLQPGLAGVPLTALLEDARREIKRCGALHGLADRVFPFGWEGMGIALSAEEAQTWGRHSTDAIRNADDAQMSLCNGASFAKAAVDAGGVAMALPKGDIVQRAWLLAAEQLLDKAIVELCRARRHVRGMQHALSMLFTFFFSIMPLDID